MPSSQAPENGVDLDALAPDALDRLDQGVIGLDPAGTVVVFSEGASAISGLSREAVLGRDYFRDVMPGTNVPSFRGRFLAGGAAAPWTRASIMSSVGCRNRCGPGSGCATDRSRAAAP